MTEAVRQNHCTLPWKLRNNCGMRSPLPTVGPFVEVIYAPAVSGEGITCLCGHKE